MDFSVKFLFLEFFGTNQDDMVYCHPDTLIAIRIIDNFDYPFVLYENTPFTDFLAYWCGGKRETGTETYYFRSQKGKNHFIQLIEGFDTKTHLTDYDLTPPPWTKVDELDDIPW